MKGYIVKLYPNKDQRKQLDKNFGCARFIYNQMIIINQKKYHRMGKGLSGYDMQAYLPKLKKQYPWLKESNSQSLQIVCHNLADAYNKFFRKEAGYPNFKKKNSKDSFSNITNCQLLEKQVKLPKVGLIKFRAGNKPEGKAKRFTVYKDVTGYYCSILIDTPKTEILQEEVNNILGIDLGIKDFAILSNGAKIKNQKFLKQSQLALRKWQKALSRREKTSKKGLQAKIMVGKIHKKIANQRKDYAHKISRQVVNSCDNQTAIAVESLNIQGMMKNHKLAKAIADCGWSQFLGFINYKSKDVGKQVIEIGRFFPSSKTCSSCGIVNSNLKLKDRSWGCSSCGTNHDRDINASINIALEGARTWFRKNQGGEEMKLDQLLQNIRSSSLAEADKF